MRTWPPSNLLMIRDSIIGVLMMSLIIDLVASLLLLLFQQSVCKVLTYLESPIQVIFHSFPFPLHPHRHPHVDMFIGWS